MVAANGDTLLMVGEDVPLPIDGGSGRFEDATGWVTSEFVLLEPGVFSNDMNGEVQY